MCLSLKIESPERIILESFYKGYEWAIVHNGRGSRGGYVKVNPNHPVHGKNYNDLDFIYCHGGLTFSEADVPCDKEVESNGWWLGFDCAHFDDLPDPELFAYQPSMDFHRMFLEGFVDDATIKDNEFVENECKKIINQLIHLELEVNK